VALGAHAVGHYILRAGHYEAPQAKNFAEVVWSIRGRGRLVIDGVEVILPPEHIAVYLPGMVHEFTAIDDWEMRWWTMDGPLAADTMNSMGLYPGVFRAGPAPVELFEALQKAIISPSLKGERAASALAYELLTLTHGLGTINQHDALVNEVLVHLETEWSDQDLSVAALARRFGVHRATLTNRFKDAFGTSPMDYIIGVRIQNAMSLLRLTTHTVTEIAHQCGFKDPNYFARLFRSRTGSTPLEFRKQES